MSDFNYITDKLLKKVDIINSRLSPDTHSFLNIIVDKIISKLNSYDRKSAFLKKYGDLKLDREYKISKENNIKLEQDKRLGFDYNDDILSKLNKKCVYILFFKGKKLDINVYYNKDYDQHILDKNINKLMTRLWNLITIFERKKNTINTQFYNFEYNWYLYNNVKRANKNKDIKCGDLIISAQYLKELNTNRCFNSQNGLTINLMEKIYSNISRLEESIGLLTHEFMHVIQLNAAGLKLIPNIDLVIQTEEIFINTFASIINVFLLWVETGKKHNLELMMKNEIIYSIINFIRLSKITGYDLDIIYDKNRYTHWYQDINIYEYIVGKFLLYLNFNKINDELIDNNFSSIYSFTDQYDKLSIDDVIKFHNNDDNILKIYNEVKLIEESFSDKENDDICGNMIMQYFLYDPIEIEEHHKLNDLYGGKNTKLNKKSKTKKYINRLSKNKKSYKI
jgi:hypothetical protein